MPTLTERHFTALCGPSPSKQSLHFGIGLTPLTETPIGIHKHLQHLRTLNKELEEGKLTPLPSEIMD